MPEPASRLAIALAGAVSLAVAMGIGRFAFTPLLPMMLHDGVVDLAVASWLASANYVGYLAGALVCMFQPWLWERAPRLPNVNATAVVRSGLVATGVLTLAMALPTPALWPLLRFAAGVASAVVFVYSSGWCLAQLAQRDAGALGGLMFTGPGAGIVVSGLFATGMVSLDWRATAGWLIFGAIAFALTASVWRIFRGDAGPQPAAAAATALGHTGTVPQRRGEVGALALAYGLAGFGYIITATFLPVIAREALADSAWLDLFWPIFGAGIVIGALIATRLRITGDLRALLAGCYAVQALGIAVGLWAPSLAGFAIGSLLLGMPFTAITFFAMQEVRRLRPENTAGTIGALTATYGVGQIVGPPLVAWLLRSAADPGHGFTLSLQIAMAALLAGVALYLWMIRNFPMGRAASRP